MEESFITKTDIKSANQELLSPKKDDELMNTILMIIVFITIVGIIALIYQRSKEKSEKEIMTTDKNGNKKKVNLDITIDDVHEALGELSNLSDEEI